MTLSYSYDPKTVNPGKKRRGSDEEETEDDGSGFAQLLEMKKKPYKEFSQTFTAQHVHFYISKPIGAPDEYTEMIHRMTVSGPQDVIFIHLNTPGGQLNTGVALINAMQNSQAKIVTVLEGEAYSLGSLIFLAGDEMVVNENCLMMVHNFNGGLIGKGNEMVSELEASIKWFAVLAKDIYVPFLSEEELARIVRGEDFWMQTAEIRSRLENMVKIMAEEELEEKKAALAVLEQVQKDAAKLVRDAKKAALKKEPPKKESGYRHGPARRPVKTKPA